jgi:integrase
VDTIRGYMKKASSPIEIRDCAIMLLGTDMGMRGADIVSLSLADIDWKNQCIRFRQSKTGAETWLAMPTGVGNAIYRYLKEARPRDTKSDSVFVSTRTPHGGITRSVCYGTLRRVLPERDVPGSGFHVTRKSFSTNRLRNGISPAGIADALGHSGTDNLRPYLSLDVRNMSKCPLSLVYLGIPVEGGRR